MILEPAPGAGRLMFTGETLRPRLMAARGAVPEKARAFLRTDLNSSPEKRREIIRRVEQGAPRFSTGWHDVPMRQVEPGVFEVELIAFQPGYYEFKPYLSLPHEIVWPEGPNASVSVHPLKWRGGNTIYCAFPRQFGPFKSLDNALEATNPPEAVRLDQLGYTVIPPSGNLADLARELPFLFEELGVRILHLLPVQETPTHYARLGRFGSPYAAADMRNVNHAYTLFRRDQTPDEQFREFCARVHAYGGEVLLDLSVNHLGWSTELLNEHPEWFLRGPDGRFASPGVWGVTWEDLVELDFSQKAVWKYLAESLILWCEREVDGFRCDAGHMIPLEVWEYVTARVHQVFPDILFLFEGLGGPWEDTEAALRMGGMQWAYSEMFQQNNVEMIRGYLHHLDRCCSQTGILANYAETHDNNRLALGGERYVRARLALCALSSTAGAFGFTNGVEWLATEKVDVHGSSGLRWGNPNNVVDWIRMLNRLLRQHPVFHGTARMISMDNLPADVVAFRREKGEESLLVAINLNAGEARSGIQLRQESTRFAEKYRCLLTGREFDLREAFSLEPFEVACVDLKRPEGSLAVVNTEGLIRGTEEENRLRAILGELWGQDFDLNGFADLMKATREAGLRRFLGAAALGRPRNAGELAQKVREISNGQIFLGVSEWSSTHGDRLHLLSTDQLLYLEEEVPFRVRLVFNDRAFELNTYEDFGNSRFVAFARVPEGRLTIELSRLDRPTGQGEPKWLAAYGPALCLGESPRPVSLRFSRQEIQPSHRFLLSSSSGSYMLMPLAPRTVTSKYDALLAANLHPAAPDERVVLLKRLRIWLATPLTSYPLSLEYLVEFQRWPWPTWSYQFQVAGGVLRVQEQAQMGPGDSWGRIALGWEGLAATAGLALIVRPDVEFRGHHGQTKANRLDQEALARSHEALPPGQAAGFRRAVTDQLEFVVRTNFGEYKPQPEWTYNISHSHEGTRGQDSLGDAFSPGYFRLPLEGRKGTLGLEFGVRDLPRATGGGRPHTPKVVRGPEPKLAREILRKASQQFLARRGMGRTILAGYPWFLDWGRDTFIAARGYLAEGRAEEVRDMAIAFAALERQGTLPNLLAADDVSNRETSDAPLWFLRLLQELAKELGWKTLRKHAHARKVDLEKTVQSICHHYQNGAPQGIRCDPATGLVYSPPHFTWMDTNYPAVTPREGYPIEIQALWISGLEFAAKVLGQPEYARLAAVARPAFLERFWMPELGYFADSLPARPGVPPAAAGRDESLRPNQLYAVAFGLAGPMEAQSVVVQTCRHLVVPAGLRSVANLPLTRWPWVEGAAVPHGVDPMKPYRGRYEGDEDSSRKLAYHNGTVWAHLLPLWIEALLVAFRDDPRAERLAKAFLRTYEQELRRGCVGQVAEIFDGDYPHSPRGCCAQAWAVTEVLRVWKILDKETEPGA